MVLFFIVGCYKELLFCFYNLCFVFVLNIVFFSKESDDSDIEVDIEGNDEDQVIKEWQKFVQERQVKVCLNFKQESMLFNESKVRFFYLNIMRIKVLYVLGVVCGQLIFK